MEYMDGEYMNGGCIYWTGYAIGYLEAQTEAAKAVNYNAIIKWVAENPMISFDIYDEEEDKEDE